MRALDDGVNWMTLHAFHYDTDVPLDGCFGASYERLRPQAQAIRYGLGTAASPIGYRCRITIPANYVTDFASIPRPLWGIVGAPATGVYRKIAPVHDFLYRQSGLATRGQADAVLNEGMKFLQVGRWTRWEIYAGVRVGGHSSYKGGL